MSNANQIRPRHGASSHISAAPAVAMMNPHVMIGTVQKDCQ